MRKPKIIDNFLDKEYFNELYNLICGYGGGSGATTRFEWYYGADVVRKGHDSVGGGWAGELQTTTDDDSAAKDNVSLLYLFTNLIYVNDVPISQHYNAIEPFLKKIKTIEGEKEFKSLLRIRANFFGNTHTLHEHPMHIDYEFPHTAALLSLNTCDGYTKIADGTKLDSVANRLILFDAGEDHCSTTTTNAKARFNLIVNYI